MVILWIVLGLIAALLLVLVVRALLFKPKKEQRAAPEPVSFDEQRAVESLRQMVMCKTVSYHDRSKQDEAEFEKFRELLKTRYPLIHKNCSLERIGPAGMLYTWKGESSDAPSVLMSHYDVVPVNEDQWQKPPFSGVIEDGELWGRGTLDTKGTLCGVMESVETLMAEGFTPKNDIYLAFGGDEETAGASAQEIVSEFERRGVKPALVVDEGGAVVEGVFPGVKQPTALVGIAEKGIMDLTMTTKSTGGHASAPPPHGPVGILAKAVVDAETKPFPFKLTPAAAEMFDTLGRHSSFALRIVFANLWLFKPVLSAMTKKSGGELNALVRTTCAFTQMQGSKASNVLPPEASVGANLRIITGETPGSAVEYLRGAIKNDDIKIDVVHSSNPSIASDTNSPAWQKVKSAIEQTWTDAIVSPYLMIAASDSRHYSKISDKVMRFSAMALSTEDRARIHANDERIALDKIGTTVAFYIRLVKQC